MIEINARGQRLVRAGDVEGLRALLAPIRAAVLADPLAGFGKVMAEAPEEDQQIMNDPIWQHALERGIRTALEPGLDGWVDETVAMMSPWSDFDVDGVRADVTWWHAEDDRNVPLSAARRLVDQLGNGRLNVWSQGGHLTPYKREGEILDELIARG